MIKLLLCILSGIVIAALLLQLRQQKLQLNYQANQLHTQIEQQQAKLWGQQYRIAESTAPNAIANTIGYLDVKMVPQSLVPPSAPVRAVRGGPDPDAE